VNLLGDVLPVLDLSVDVRVLEHDTAKVFGDLRLCEELGDRADGNLNLEAFGSSVEDGDGLDWLRGSRRTTPDETTKVFLPLAKFIDMTMA
jgi:hypothetical protein